MMIENSISNISDCINYPIYDLMNNINMQSEAQYKEMKTGHANIIYWANNHRQRPSETSSICTNIKQLARFKKLDWSLQAELGRSGYSNYQIPENIEF